MTNCNLLLDNEIIKPIYNTGDYYISNKGNVYSFKNNRWKKLSPYVDSRNKYLLIKLEKKSCLIHRLVAQAFIPNPENLPEVNHKDKNTKNSNVENLEWCTRIDNLRDSYSTLSPVRNFNSCELYVNNQLVGNFQSITKACKYAKKHYGASESSLSKYLKWKNIYIKTLSISRNIKKETLECKSYNKKPIRLYKNGFFIKEFSTFSEMSKYYNDILGVNVSSDTLRARYNRHTIIDNYEIKRN